VYLVHGRVRVRVLAGREYGAVDTVRWQQQESSQVLRRYQKPVLPVLMIEGLSEDDVRSPAVSK
jgi:hypothetical protein